MQIKKQKENRAEKDEERLMLIGIQSSFLSFHRFCFLLNNSLRLELKQKKAFTRYFSEDKSASFPLAFYSNEVDKLEYRVLENRGLENILLQEKHPTLDKWLLIEGEISRIDANHILNQLKEIPELFSVDLIPHTSFENMEHFLEDLEFFFSQEREELKAEKESNLLAKYKKTNII